VEIERERGRVRRFCKPRTGYSTSYLLKGDLNVKKRKILFATFLALSVIALSNAYQPSSIATVLDQCSDCKAQCLDESLRVEYQCLYDGGLASGPVSSTVVADCWQKRNKYRLACESLFCNYTGICGGGGIVAPGSSPSSNGSIVVGGLDFDELETCLLNAHQVRQECGDSPECVEAYENALNTCEGRN
jgi:hypothetical protein